jgi:hypothetical protein
MFCFFENANRQISGTGTDLQDFVCGAEIRLVYNCLRDLGILEDVLAKSLSVEDWVSNARRASLAIVVIF